MSYTSNTSLNNHIKIKHSEVSQEKRNLYCKDLFKRFKMVKIIKVKLIKIENKI